jgi:arginine deiminase
VLTTPVERPLITSEVERLRRVLVHRPGREFGPAAEYLAAEHDRLCALLSGRGVQVLYHEDLLADILRDRSSRRQVIEATLAVEDPPPSLRVALGSFLDGRDPEAVAGALLRGVRVAELELSGDTLSERLRGPDKFVLAPLPHHVFVRDGSAWVHDRQTLIEPLDARRARELSLLRAVYTRHLLFDGTVCPPPAVTAAVGRIDVVVASPDSVLIGLNEETRPAAVERLAMLVLRETPVRRVYAVELPRRACLDALLALVDHATVLAHTELEQVARVYRLSAPGSTVRADPEPSLKRALAAALGTPMRLLTVEDELATDVLAIAPGVVVAADRNVRGMAALHEAGVEVLSYSYSGLQRGPRAMICPLNRGPVRLRHR